MARGARNTAVQEAELIVSFEQCQATVSGIGGFCVRNRFSGYATEPQRQLSAVTIRNPERAAVE